MQEINNHKIAGLKFDDWIHKHPPQRRYLQQSATPPICCTRLPEPVTTIFAQIWAGANPACWQNFDLVVISVTFSFRILHYALSRSVFRDQPLKPAAKFRVSPVNGGKSQNAVRLGQIVMMIKLNSQLVPIIVGLLVIMQLAFPYRGWMILLVSLGGLWLVSYLWAKSLARNLRLTREMRFGWAHVGDQLEERFTLTNRGLIPALWVEIIDHTTMPDYNASRVTGIEGKSQNRWHTHGLCTRRGVFTLGPTTLTTSDPFGLYTVSLHQPDASTLTVTPPIVPLPVIEVAPGGRAGEGRSRANPFEKTVSSIGIRKYIPGDSLNQIHWPTSARQGELYVRQFDSTPAGDWWIFLDLDEHTQVGQGFNSTEEHSIILAASLADRGLKMGKAVGLVSHGESLVWLPPDNSDNQRHQIMRALAQIVPGSISLTSLLTQARPDQLRAASLILITANTSGDWLTGLLPLRQRGAIPTILLLDPTTFDGPVGTGAVEPTLVELGISHTIITRDVLDRPEARPGRAGQWEWQISPSGRAIPVRKPPEMSWRMLK
jgi:uncharacterized protein (DUF58 family)